MNQPPGLEALPAALRSAQWRERPAAWDQSWIRAPGLKRSCDLAAALGGLLVLSPLIIVLAVAIKVTSRGPVFYRGLRTGRYARPFRIFKFRTMVVNAEQLGGSTTGQGDARITPIGAWMRKCKLDELPQLLNVLRGEMSLVGPRPEVYEYTRLFRADEQLILAVRPGITDLSSLHFIDLQSHVGSEDPDEVFRRRILPVKNRLRQRYVRHHSPRLDAGIVAATLLRLCRLPWRWGFTLLRLDPQELLRASEPKCIGEPRHAGAAPATNRAAVPSANAPSNESVTLGSSGLRIGRLGMGCWAIGGHGWGPVDDETSIAAIRAAVDSGINHFDTADVYGRGHSESLLAEALGSQRHELVIATKFGVRFDPQGRSYRDLSAAHCRAATEASLRRLGLETLPVLYAHWPDDKTPVEELMDSLLRLKREGKILAIGLSNFSAAAVRRAVACGPVDVVQFQYSLIDRAGLAEVHPLLREHNIAAISWGALGRGLLTGKFTAETRFPEDDSRRCDAHFVGAAYRRNLQMAARVRAIAEQRGLAGSQVALRFVLDSPGITASLFGAKSPEQVEENRGALGWRLSPSEVAELKADPPADTPLATPGEAAA